MRKVRLMTTGLLALAIGAGWSLLLISEADAAVICASKKNPNKVKFRGGDACKKNENPVSLAEVPGLQGPKGEKGDRGEKGDTGPAGPQGQPGVGAGFRVVDDNGVLVGVVTGLEEVIRREGDMFLLFHVNKDGFAPERCFEHTGPNCSGTIYMGRDLPQHPLIREALGLNGVLYYPGDPIELHPFKSVSCVAAAAECSGNGGTLIPGGLCCYESIGYEGLAGPVATLDVSGLVPPFHVEGP